MYKQLNSLTARLRIIDVDITSDTDAVGDIYKEHKFVKTGPEASCLAIKVCDYKAFDLGRTHAVFVYALSVK